MIRKDEVLDLKLEEIIPYSKNAKIHTKQQINHLKTLIETDGFDVFIVVDENNVILKGHGRLLALKELGWTSVKCIKKWGLSEERKEIIRISDNKVGEADWNFKLLKEEFQTMKSNDFDILATGFSELEIEGIMGEKEIIEDVVEVDAYERAKSKTKIKLGDLFSLGNHRLLCGDATNPEHTLQVIGDKKPILMVTDPPYNIGFQYNEYKDKKSNEEYKKLLIKSIINQKAERKIISIGKQNIKTWYEISEITDMAIWYSKNKMSGGKVSNLSLWEPIIFIGSFNRNSRATDVYEFTNELQKETGNHTCPKTVKLFAELIKCYSNNNELIYDPFLGSGTTLIACEQLKRNCIGIEVDPIYCQVIIDRFEKFSSKKAEKLN